MIGDVVTRDRAGEVLAVVGMAALALRSYGWDGAMVPVLVGAGALAVSAPQEPTVTIRTKAGALLLGLVAVATVAALFPVPAAPAGALVVLASVAVAVGEEAFFRRFLYGRLLAWGVLVAVVGTAVLFALVHIPGYGTGSVPVNLGAGLLFGWQRWVTGGWGTPALTHAAANLMALGWGA
jgi:membrane protease YdiL (CAAX protease family)